MGSNDDSPAGVPSAGLLVGDIIGYGPWATTVGLSVTLWVASIALDGVVAGANENVPPRDPSIGLGVGGTTTPGEVGAFVRLGVFSWPSVFGRDGVGVGSSDSTTPDVPPVGVLVGDAVETRSGFAVGPGVSLPPDSSLASGAHIGANEVVPPTECPVGPLVGVTVSRSDTGAPVGSDVCRTSVVFPIDGGGTGRAKPAPT